MRTALLLAALLASTADARGHRFKSKFVSHGCQPQAAQQAPCQSFASASVATSSASVSAQATIQCQPAVAAPCSSCGCSSCSPGLFGRRR